MVLAKTNLRVTVPLAVLAAQRSLWGKSVDEAFEVDKRKKKKKTLGLTDYMHGVKIPIVHRDHFGGPIFLPQQFSSVFLVEPSYRFGITLPV